MTPHLTAFCVSFVFIFLKAWQQQNVVHKQFIWVMPTSFGLAMCEFYLIGLVARTGDFTIAFWMGTGAGLGAMLSMFLHGRMTKQ
jgi:hypothetical protein